MDAKKVLAIRKTKEYLRLLIANGFHIKKVYLYGSYTRGNYREESDIDIIVISEDFSGSKFFDSLKIIKFRRNIDVRIEPIAYRPEDFTNSDPLAAEVIKTGEEIKLQ